MNAAEDYNVIPMPTVDLHHSAQPLQSVPSVQEIPGGGNIEKIRDILFGAQMRDYDRRFARLEERLLKEAADAREDARRRFDSLEIFIKQEINALGDRMKSEAQQRTQSDEDLTRELRDSARSLANKINALDENSSQTQRELRQQLLDQAKNLADEIRQKYDDLASRLQREAHELRNDKTDRAALANLFTELAMRLNNEFRLPGDE
jgi:DNA anti-recombination protein RmuC